MVVSPTPPEYFTVIEFVCIGYNNTMKNPAIRMHATRNGSDIMSLYLFVVII